MENHVAGSSVRICSRIPPRSPSISRFGTAERSPVRVHAEPRRLESPLGGTRNLRLIVIAPLGYRLTRAGKLLYRRPAYLICTDATLPLNQVLQAYLWRWDIEVNLRDEKTVLGVGQAQVRHVHAVQNVPATAVAAYALLLLAAAQAYGPAGQPHTLPLPAWRRRQPPVRATTMRLINQLRCELWGQAIRQGGLEHFSTRPLQTHNTPKPTPTLESALFYAFSA